MSRLKPLAQESAIIRVNYLHELVIYMASKVKHRLNIFLEKTVMITKNELILDTFVKIDKVATINSIF